MNKLQNVFRTHKKGFLMTLVFLMLVLIVGVSCVFGIKGKENAPRGSEVVAETITPRNSGKWTDEGNYATSFAGGTGTETNPYLISNGAQLAKVASDVNSGTVTFDGIYFKLTSDIDLLDYYWVQIGLTWPKGFAGHIDGDYHVIKGMVINSTTNRDVGLIGSTYLGKITSIKNLGIIESEINLSYPNSDFDIFCGAFVGYTALGRTDFTNCFSEVNINITTKGDVYCGGLVGNGCQPQISNCYNAGNISVVSGGAPYVGGLAGNISGTYGDSSTSYLVGNSYNKGNLNVELTAAVANVYINGLGYFHNDSLTFVNCFNIGGITLTGVAPTNKNVGGGIDCNGSSMALVNVYFDSTKISGRFNGFPDINYSGIYGGVPNLSEKLKIGKNYNSGSLGTYTSDDGATGNATIINWKSGYYMMEPSLNDGYPVLKDFYNDKYWLANPATSFDSGSGTSSSPYLISTPQQLAKLTKDCSWGETYEDKYFKLKNNIDLSGKLWTPIGTNKTDVFAGNFDGAGFEITGMTIEGDYAYAGLFGRCAKTNSTVYTIQNIKLSNVNLNVNETSGTTYNVGYGPLIGVAASNSVIKNCEILSGNITPVLNHAGYVGGLIGYVSNATIDGCTNNITVNAKGTELYVGGLVGEAYIATISNSYNYGQNIATTTLYGMCQGGIVGNAYTTTILKSTNFGNITSTANGGNYVGGITGKVATKLEIIESYNQGAVNGTGVTGTVGVGGLVGYVNGGTVSITNSYNTASVKGISNESYAVVGALIAFSAGSVSISVEHCYNIGSVSAQSEKSCEVGGLFGGANSGDSIEINFVNCFSSASLTGSSTSGANRSGGLSGTGITGLVFSNCYFDSSSFSGSAIHTSGTTENLSNSGKVGYLYELIIMPKNYGTARFSGYTDDNSTSGYAQWSEAWDFDDIWFLEVSLNRGYPIFKREVEGKYWLQEKATSFAGGTGTETDPYLISTPQQLAKISYDVYNQNSYTGKYFKLTNDIDLAGKLWTPIGFKRRNYSFYCSGNLDGNKHIIKGMTIDGYYDYAGLFGYFLGKYIKNLGVDEGNIINANMSNSYSGGLIGYSNSSSLSISGCYNKLNITGRVAGGLIGYVTVRSMNMISCYNEGKIKTGQYGYTGGIVGQIGSSQIAEINKCYNLGSIEGNAVYYAGGLVGYNSSDSFKMNECFNSGKIDVTGNCNSGGLIGFSSSMSFFLSNSFNEGSVKGGESSYSGGLIGKSTSKTASISECFNSGIISTSLYGYAGGLISYNGSNYSDASLTIIKSFNIGNITNTSYAGGIIGVNYSNLCLYNSFVECDMINVWHRAGGLISSCYNTPKLEIDSCYYKGEINSSLSQSNSSYPIGGLIGTLKCSTESYINNCYAISTIKVSSLSNLAYVNSFIGYQDATYKPTISNYYASADITYSGGTSTSKVYNGTFASDKWFYHENFRGGELTLKSIYLIGKGVDTTAEQNLERLTGNGFPEPAA